MSSTWMVTMMLLNGKSAMVEVIASNRPDAEYRGAMKVEETYGATERLIRCVPCR